MVLFRVFWSFLEVECFCWLSYVPHCHCSLSQLFMLLVLVILSLPAEISSCVILALHNAFYITQIQKPCLLCIRILQLFLWTCNTSLFYIAEVQYKNINKVQKNLNVNTFLTLKNFMNHCITSKLDKEIVKLCIVIWWLGTKQEHCPVNLVLGFCQLRIVYKVLRNVLMS